MYCRICKDQNADHVTSDHPTVTSMENHVDVAADFEVEVVDDECPVCAARRERERLRKRKQRAKG